MTREEAIARVKHQRDWANEVNRMLDVEAFDMAIKALEQETSEDAISRQAVKEQMIKYGFHAPDMTVTEFFEEIDRVEYGTDGNAYRITISNGKELGQVPKTGRWLKDRVVYSHPWECSNCGAYHRALYDYCPSCGAKMEG